jgi:uncharacterized protein (DUF1330 family)
MPAYVISDVALRDPAAAETYRARAAASIARYGGRYLVRGGTVEVLEGDWAPRAVVIAEFPDMERAGLVSLSGIRACPRGPGCSAQPQPDPRRRHCSPGLTGPPGAPVCRRPFAAGSGGWPNSTGGGRGGAPGRDTQLAEFREILIMVGFRDIEARRRDFGREMITALLARR